jgi:L-asparaginase / beta-aspartyl-peptidase
VFWVLNSRFAVAVLVAFASGCRDSSDAERPQWALVIHGGSGVIERGSLTADQEAQYRAALSGALESGATVLRGGGRALDAVEFAIRILEDDPLFNAGRGAVFTAAGRNELDASIMDGATLRAGAVAGVTRARHPISVARAVMEKSLHVLLSGDGADGFAREQGLETVDPSFFFTERRWQDLERALRERGEPVPARPANVPAPAPQRRLRYGPGDPRKLGTVGVVALDSQGNLAAGTSTGGTNAKRWGRVGDSPIIGAGTYAANESCAVSGTGVGEFFIRLTIAREVCALVQYTERSVQEAADEVIKGRLTAAKGSGGVIVLSRSGAMAWSFNTPGMYRARTSATTSPQISIFADEP